ncbi:MAG: hypothetical protein AABZ06_00125 [Bdellovibrionota bacterium]
MKKMCFLIMFCLLNTVSISFAGDHKCGVCNMKIGEQSKHHVVLSDEAGSKAPLHVCSLSCVNKARKHDSGYSKSQVSDFNNPEKLLPGEDAFFLMKSEKIKQDLDDMAMPPFFGAFKTKAEADAAKKKYGDGVIVKGLGAALIEGGRK